MNWAFAVKGMQAIKAAARIFFIAFISTIVCFFKDTVFIRWVPLEGRIKKEAISELMTSFLYLLSGLLAGLVVSGVKTVQNLGCDIHSLVYEQQSSLVDDNVVTVCLVVLLNEVVNGLIYLE